MNEVFDTSPQRATRWMGSPVAFIIVAGSIVVWGAV
jgi:low affinity Fe/Cu permease